MLTKVSFDIAEEELPIVKEVLLRFGAENIETEDDVDVPDEHWESIQQGKKEIEIGLGIPAELVMKRALERCTR